MRKITATRSGIIVSVLNSVVFNVFRIPSHFSTANASSFASIVLHQTHLREAFRKNKLDSVNHSKLVKITIRYYKYRDQHLPGTHVIYVSCRIWGTWFPKFACYRKGHEIVLNKLSKAFTRYVRYVHSLDFIIPNLAISNLTFA